MSLASIKAIKKLPQFGVIQALWMELSWGTFAYYLKKKAKGLYVEVGGSDLYRESERPILRLAQKNLIRHADIISSENEQTKDFFYKVYGNWTKKIPHRIVRFGVDIIDDLAELKDVSDNNCRNIIRSKWNIPDDKCIIMLGYNRNRAHQHIDLINALRRVDKKLIEKCFFIIPMTYGPDDSDYCESVEDAIKSLTSQYIILERFMNSREMAETVVLTDILIHVQTTDQLSSTMMAHLYNGNIVIAGKWLPYSGIKEADIQFWDVDNVADLKDVIPDIVLNIDHYKAICLDNDKKAYSFSSWECCAKDWFNIYEILSEGII